MSDTYSGCCYDDVPPNRVAQCEDGHLFCLECSRRGAEAELGYRRTVLKCMTDGCTAVFTDAEAVKFLPKPVLQGLFRARQQNELKMAGLDSLVECPFCSYAAVVENDQDKEFRCQAPRCRKVSCRLCKALTHIPQSCEEYRQELEKNNVLLVQHKVEEQMSEALIRECPQCKSRFFKTEGCNKMTCPECGTKMCYICKKKIRDYSHFDQSPASEPASRPTRKQGTGIPVLTTGEYVHACLWIAFEPSKLTNTIASLCIQFVASGTTQLKGIQTTSKKPRRGCCMSCKQKPPTWRLKFA
ncbi:hypothetical protein BC939DRAFT_401724 [Gamsiella multidivaricata]|uniref:uncharacterized protein n=1 Tax=Gamsiella multidivaricata TaxID=101098 RepID=UPI002220D28B|nr:uncharacterized protein BC939DRAFT_401724 [Gamsiella multidivaricata]KAI7818206.1 hypothetical protein BC939DRAFT_401724 [Gamsiella multidivaricata]